MSDFSTYFTSPRPYGQQSTSYRTVGGNLSKTRFTNGYDVIPATEKSSDNFLSTNSSSNSRLRNYARNDFAGGARRNSFDAQANYHHDLLRYGNISATPASERQLFTIPRVEHQRCQPDQSYLDKNRSIHNETGEMRSTKFIPIHYTNKPFHSSETTTSFKQNRNRWSNFTPKIRSNSAIPFQEDKYTVDYRSDGGAESFSSRPPNRLHYFDSQCDDTKRSSKTPPLQKASYYSPPQTFADERQISSRSDNEDKIPIAVSNSTMKNVAQNVRAELEQDPKFRRKAAMDGKGLEDSDSPPKQSPCFRQMNSFLSKHAVMSDTRQDPHLSFELSSPANANSTNNNQRFMPNVSGNSAANMSKSFENGHSFGETRAIPMTIAIRVGLSGAGESSFGLNNPSLERELQRVEDEFKEYGLKDAALGSNSVASASITNGSTTSRSSVPPGILHRSGPKLNDNAIKVSKRVAFECDQRPQSVKSNGSTIVHEMIPSAPASRGDIPYVVAEHDNAVDGPLKKFIEFSKELDGDIQTVTNMVASAVDIERKFIWTAAGRTEPASIEGKEQLLTPLKKIMVEASEMAESSRRSEYFNHISAVSNGLQIFLWLIMKPEVVSYMKDMIEAAQFYGNRIMKEFKDTKIHSDWIKAFLEVLNAIKLYAARLHTKGLTWNSCPVLIPAESSIVVTSQTRMNLPKAVPTPPPPPPPPPPSCAISADRNASNIDRSALFAEINTGEEIASRLKKVKSDMRTHKNPALRANQEEAVHLTKGESKYTDSSVATRTTKKDVDKEPRTVLENGKQWNVEYHKNNQNLVIEVGNMKQTLYVFKCENSIIQVKGKLNSITLDDCKRVSIVFDSLLSQFEVINSQGVKIQAMGTMPTLSIQKTDGCQVFLSKDAMKAEMITSKSSEMNVLIPIGTDDEFVEFSLPEQFKTTFDGTKLKTTVSDIA